MMKPTSPRKSPRVSLGARDLSDEHFSPQKRKLSASIEKERFSENLHKRRKVAKLDFDIPIR